jgi:hypothetical protein
MAAKFLSLAALVAWAAALQSCNRRPAEHPSEVTAAAAHVINVQWTDQAAKRTVSSGKLYALPQLRVYDADGRLVYDVSNGAMNPATIGSAIDGALKSGRIMDGPSLQTTLADLQTSRGRPAPSVIARPGTPLIFDYWASWCIPCKMLEKALLT